MTTVSIEQEVALWLVNGAPVRMIYAGRMWRVTDTPTRLRDSIWTAPLEQPGCLHGWRFQGTDDNGRALVFDVYRAEDIWHVHRKYE